MPYFRVKKNANYTVISNFIFKDKKLSFKAKGMLCMLLSLPEDKWEYSVKGLASTSSDGVDAVRRILNELEIKGYLVRTRERDENGRLGRSVYTVYEIPQPKSEPPTLENPIQAEPMLNKQTQLNTNSINNSKELNNKIDKTSLHTTQAHETRLEQLISSIERKVGRSLYGHEQHYCLNWYGTNLDFELIGLAVDDNLFRKERFELKHVQDTLDKWKLLGISDARKARNYMLENRVENARLQAKELSKGNDELAQDIFYKNNAVKLKGMRDYLIELYYSNRKNELLSIISSPEYIVLIKYLPEEIEDYLNSHINNE